MNNDENPIEENEDVSIRKYRKKVNKNGWMMRIQKWTSGKKEIKYVGYCPFFWTTWFCVLISPLTAAGKVAEFLIKLCREFFKREPKINEARLPKLSKPRKIKMPSVADILRFYEFYSQSEEKDLRFIKTWTMDSEDEYLISFADEIEWARANPNWLAIVEVLKRNKAIKELRDEAMKLRKAKMKVYVDKAVSFLQWFVKPAMFASIAVASYYVYKLVWFVGGLITMEFIKMLASGALLAAATIITILVAIAIIKGIQVGAVKVINLFPRSELSCKPVDTKDSLLITIFRGIGNAFDFLVETVSMAYKKECPLIEWGDEDGKIVKNKKD